MPAVVDRGGGGADENAERQDEHGQHGQLHVVRFDLLAEVFGRSPDHQSGDEDGEHDEEEHAVHPGADAAEDHFAEHDVEQRDRAADRREGVVPRVDRAAGGVGGDRGEERGVADAEADFFPFHVAVRRGDAERVDASDCRVVRRIVAMNAPARKRIDIAQKTAQPWRSLPVIDPSV